MKLITTPNLYTAFFCRVVEIDVMQFFIKLSSCPKSKRKKSDPKENVVSRSRFSPSSLVASSQFTCLKKVSIGVSAAVLISGRFQSSMNA
mmetsp:Transcript_14416/g.30741  ORF Transcript_14416/g.30741 Transcript_14416/m.30741 type:complete len:90 (+) Transcript_14416:93-362(+)